MLKIERSVTFSGELEDDSLKIYNGNEYVCLVGVQGKDKAERERDAIAIMDSIVKQIGSVLQKPI